MSKQRMRYQWFREVPRNVTRREYQRLQFLQFAGVGTGALSALMAITAIISWPLVSVRQLSELKPMTVAEASAYTGDRSDVVKLEGFLVAEEPLTMPDDDARQIIRGRLQLMASADTTSEDDSPLRAVLLEWEDSAERVFLSDGENRVPLAFDLAVLPMRAETGDLTPDTIRSGDAPRTRRPVAIAYGADTFPLPAEWGEVERVSTDLERQVLPQGQVSVVVAAVESTPQGPQLVDPLGDRLQVTFGSEQDLRQAGQRMRTLFGVLCVPLGIGSFFLFRSASALRREFVMRSNQ